MILKSFTKKLWNMSGRIGFWLTWPAMAATIYFTKRTRILVVCGDEILLGKGWFGSGRWILPGGGLHRGEEPAEGAARELKEETGISVNKSQLKPLFASRIKGETGTNYFVYSFVIELDEKPDTTKQKLEITELEWQNIKKVYNELPAGRVTRKVIDRWRGLE